MKKVYRVTSQENIFSSKIVSMEEFKQILLILNSENLPFKRRPSKYHEKIYGNSFEISDKYNQSFLDITN